jgi:hypothetical protein
MSVLPGMIRVQNKYVRTPVPYVKMTYRSYELFAKAIFEHKSGRNWPQYREELLTKHKVLFEKYN